MTPPINIDGTQITGASIDGTDVTEITVDGTTVFSTTPDSLLSKWTFDSNDISGSTISDVVGNNDATNNGGTTGQTGLSPNYDSGEAISYNGSSAFSDHTTLGSFGSALDNDFALGFWIQGTSLNGVFGVDTGSSSMQLRLEFVNGEPGFRIQDNNNTTNKIKSPTDVSDGSPHHMGYNALGNGNSDDELEIYIDGTEVSTSTAAGQGDLTNVSDFSAPFFMGALNDRGSANGFIDCFIDDFRFYTKSLSSTEWSNWFNTGLI